MANWNTSYNVGNLFRISLLCLCAAQNHAAPSSPPSHARAYAGPRFSHCAALTARARSQISSFEATINTSPKKKVSSHGRVMLQLAQDVIKPSSMVRFELDDAPRAGWGCHCMEFALLHSICSKKPRPCPIAILCQE
jgi:hypothetical protein